MTPQQKYRLSDKYRVAKRAYEARPDVRAKKRAYDSRPDVAALRHRRNRTERRRAADRARNAAPERRSYLKKLQMNPERKRRARERDNASYLARGSRWIKAGVQSCRRRAIKSGVPYNPEDIKFLLLNAPARCPVLGFELTVGGKLRDSSTTIDRNTPSLGYVQGNMTIISHLANRIKTNASTAQVCAVARWLTQKEQRI